MKISGLANQWMTRDGLFASFDSEPYTDRNGRLDIRDQMVLKLLAHLESLDGNDIYVGTSHSLLNFNTRDVVRPSDRVPPFAFMHVAWGSPKHDCWVYRVSSRRLDRGRPTSDWYDVDCTSVAEAANLIVDALAYAEVPQRPKPLHNDG